LDPHGRAGTPTVHALSFAVDWATHGLRLSDEQAQEASQLRPTVGAASGRVGLKLVRIGGPLWSPVPVHHRSTFLLFDGIAHKGPHTTPPLPLRDPRPSV